MSNIVEKSWLYSLPGTQDFLYDLSSFMSGSPVVSFSGPTVFRVINGDDDGFSMSIFNRKEIRTFVTSRFCESDYLILETLPYF